MSEVRPFLFPSSRIPSPFLAGHLSSAASCLRRSRQGLSSREEGRETRFRDAQERPRLGIPTGKSANLVFTAADTDAAVYRAPTARRRCHKLMDPESRSSTSPPTRSSRRCLLLESGTLCFLGLLPLPLHRPPLASKLTPVLAESDPTCSSKSSPIRPSPSSLPFRTLATSRLEVFRSLSSRLSTSSPPTLSVNQALGVRLMYERSGSAGEGEEGRTLREMWGTMRRTTRWRSIRQLTRLHHGSRVLSSLHPFPYEPPSGQQFRRLSSLPQHAPSPPPSQQARSRRKQQRYNSEVALYVRRSRWPV